MHTVDFFSPRNYTLVWIPRMATNPPRWQPPPTANAAAAPLVQARARIAISGMTRSSSSLPLSQPTLRVHPLPTKTRDCLHLSPILRRIPHSSSCRPRPNSNNNNGPSARRLPRPLPLCPLTPPVLLHPAFPTILFLGPTMRPPPNL